MTTDLLRQINSALDTIEVSESAEKISEECNAIRDIVDRLEDTIDDKKDLEDEVEELRERLIECESEESEFSHVSGEDVSFKGNEDIYCYAVNFKDRELMETLSKCFERNIPIQKIIDTLEQLTF